MILEYLVLLLLSLPVSPSISISELLAPSTFFVIYLLYWHLCLYLLYFICIRLSAILSMFASAMIVSCLCHLWLVCIFYDLSAISMPELFTPFIFSLSCLLRLHLRLLCFTYVESSVTPSVSIYAMVMPYLYLLWFVYFLYIWVIYSIGIFCALSTPFAFISTALVPMPTSSSYYISIIYFFYFYIISFNQRYLCQVTCLSI